MPTLIENPYRSRGIDPNGMTPIADASEVSALLSCCPAHVATPLIDAHEVAQAAGVAEVWIKDERGRMGLGSFKALGAAHVIAREADQRGRLDDVGNALSGMTYVAASAGNHGLSVAAGARVFGAKAVIYLAETVPESFAERLRTYGADVVRAGAEYEASMAAAAEAADENGWMLLSDSSWEGYFDLPLRVMEGYTQLAAEAAEQIPDAPTHILLQAGVGGLAAAVAAHARLVWGDVPRIIVVEPDAAPALIESIRTGQAVATQGPVSCMGRLDCKEPSIVALNGLSRDADDFATITDEEAQDGIARLSELGFDTTPSGGAGLAALLAGLSGLGLGAGSRVLAILSEGPEDA